MTSRSLNLHQQETEALFARLDVEIEVFHELVSEAQATIQSNQKLIESLASKAKPRAPV